MLALSGSGNYECDFVIPSVSITSDMLKHKCEEEFKNVGFPEAIQNAVERPQVVQCGANENLKMNKLVHLNTKHSEHQVKSKEFFLFKEKIAFL